ncbi:MAG TPA: glycosyltransferase family A protein [Thermoguttaceae bacterium]|nr:glycosyltransferase family A protein [Thermoguttaceae bacterium]
MKIAAVTVTYKRPVQLGRMLACFLAQDYEDRELVILDDAGQYAGQQGDRWRLVSVKKRYPTLGAKRNAAPRLISPQAEAIAVWDDDDCYLPWALRASVAALGRAGWSRPGLVLHAARDGSGRLIQHRTWANDPARKLFHAAWAFRRETFERTGGYSPAVNSGEDQELMRRLERAGTSEADPCRLGFTPFLVCSWGEGPWSVPGEPPKLSWADRQGYQRMASIPSGPAALEPTRPTFFDLDRPDVVPGVQPRRF